MESHAAILPRNLPAFGTESRHGRASSPPVLEGVLDQVGIEVAGVVGDLAPIDPRIHPQVAAARSELLSLRDDDVFTMGLGVILDAVETAARRTAVR